MKIQQDKAISKAEKLIKELATPYAIDNAVYVEAGRYNYWLVAYHFTEDKYKNMDSNTGFATVDDETGIARLKITL